MQNPTITILALLNNKTYWTLDPPLEQSQISWVLEQPLALDTRFAAHPISIEVSAIAAGATPKSDTHTVIQPVVTIDIWVQIKPETEAGKQVAAEHMQTLIDQVRAIIKVNRKTATDIAYMKFGGDKALPAFGANPPHLRYQINVICLHHV